MLFGKKDLTIQSFLCDSAGKESACNAGELGSNPGLGRSPGEGKGLPIPVFWTGEFHGLYSPWGHKESDMTECFSLTFIQGITSFSSVAQSCTTLCDPMDCSTPGFPVHH